MFKLDLYYRGDLFKVVIDIIKREEGVIMYWCMLYATERYSLCCIRVDGNPLTVTSSTILHKEFETMAIDCIEDVEREYTGEEHTQIIQNA